jgi:hypothetical protein
VAFTYAEQQPMGLFMDNQHKQIIGYQDLTQEEIDLINEVKKLEARCLDLHDRLLDGTIIEYSQRDFASESLRWLTIARTDIETGFMAMVRAIAKPQPKD